jgi:hypothetical protein
MDENEKQARRTVVAALAVLSTAFGKEMPDEQIDIYINTLCDLEPDALEQAVQIVIREERFFPAIATLRAAAVRDDARLSAEEAWGFICRRIQSGGRMAGTKGLTEETTRAIDACGGWVTLCESQNPTGDRIAFVRAYAASTQREDRERVHQGRIPNRLRTAIASIGRNAS